MKKSFELFFDLASPWTCLAFHNIQPMAEKLRATIVWRPFLVDGVHNLVNETYVESRANNQGSPKWKQLIQSLQDRSALSGVQLSFPGPFFRGAR